MGSGKRLGSGDWELGWFRGNLDLNCSDWNLGHGSLSDTLCEGEEPIVVFKVRYQLTSCRKTPGPPRP